MFSTNTLVALVILWSGTLSAQESTEASRDFIRAVIERPYEHKMISSGPNFPSINLRAERPLRNGKRYYYSIQEKAPWLETEAFGIYGNQSTRYGDFGVGVYGNRRSGLHFISADVETMLALFGENPRDDLHNLKRTLIEELIGLQSNPVSSIPAKHQRGFEALGLMDSLQVTVPLLAQADQAALGDLADLVTEELLALLEKSRPDLLHTYRSSPYASEVSFEEYFMWWYHLYYSQVTEALRAQGLIEIPSAGVLTYISLPRDP